MSSFRIATLLSTTTLSGATNYDITSNINSTYDEYMFLMTDVHPSGNGANFHWSATINGSDWDVNKHSAAWMATNDEGAGDGSIDTMTSSDLTNSGNGQQLANSMGNGADETGAGILWLYKPADTTFVKRYTSIFHYYHSDNEAKTLWVSGFVDTTSAVTGIRFEVHSGNMAAGKIRMFGIS